MCERKKFGTKGFNMMYPFSLGDLRDSSIVLNNYMEGAGGSGKIPWDDLRYIFTSLVDYYISEGMRPDQVADNVYGDPELDWVVLTSANIINVRDEWPLDSREIYEFAYNKYGNDLNQIRHYETKEVKDSSDRLILPKGKIVDSGFTIPDPSSPTATLNPVGGVTNYEYESKLNDAKRSIYIISPDYLQVFLNDMKDIMRYTDSSQFIDVDLIQTENTRNTDPN